VSGLPPRVGSDRAPVVLQEVEMPIVSQRAKVALAAVNKAIPTGLMLMSTADIQQVPSISTGCESLDLAIGVGGLPQGRLVEVFGPESSGKTTLCLHIIAEAQKAGGLCCFIDAEHALDPTYARNLGVKMEDLLLSQPDYGEQALEIADMLCDCLKAGDVIVIDSVAALVPKAELEGTMENQQMALQARMMAKAMRKLVGRVSKAGLLAVFVNQVREKVGIVWGNPEETPGGRALKFHASVRLEIKRIGTIKQGEVAVANKTKVKVVKNKLAPPFREVEFEIRFGMGIDTVADALDRAAALGIVTKSGAWYSYQEERLGQGRENALELLRGRTDLLGQVKAKLKELRNAR